MQQSLRRLKDGIRELVQSQTNPVDFLAVRIEKAEATSILLRGLKIETLSEELTVGGQVRVCHRGGWGFASFNCLDQLSTALKEAIAAAQWVGSGKTIMAEVPPIQATISLQMPGTNPRAVPIAEKMSLCSHYAEVLRGVSPKIKATSVRYLDRLQQVWLITSEGTDIEQSWVDMEMRFAATARDDARVQTGQETTGSRRAYEDLLNLEPKVRAVADRAVKALSLPSIRGGTYPVVIDPILTGLFVHEAFGHLSEADIASDNPELLDVMTLGRKLGPPILNIYDGAALPEHRGSYQFDDEGVSASITPLIQAGVLVGRLHSRETSGKLQEAPTGNARCLNYQYPPLVRMTNTWIERGETAPEDLLNDIREGIYARNWLSGMTNGEMFTFAAGEAWMIRNGRLAEPIRDVTLSGNAFRTLSQIEAIGNDFLWDESGGCGKAQQEGLPVGCGGPSLRIQNVVVSGDALA